MWPVWAWDANSGHRLSGSLVNIKLLNLSLLWMHPDNKVKGANLGPTWILSALDGSHFGPMNVNGANMRPTWVLLAPDRPQVGPMKFVIRSGNYTNLSVFWWFGLRALNICGAHWTHQWIPTIIRMALYILYLCVFLLGKTKSNYRHALLAHRIKMILYLFFVL